ncbi:hypothetical protein P8C59_009131 [Phyllachora maydis]|uniref:SCP domain-containing protein n=1 Tax=Phyllachora maydis TaxID=1825666 RepID=A0AAD9ICV4_9PEZI|nr:hypothetical protein P8C59_009131 [Phyllachora maydis]
MIFKTITTPLALGLLLLTPATADVLTARALTSDQQAGLDVQNNGRRAKKVQPLAWDATLSAHAQAWADHLAQMDSLTHSSGDQRPGEGENLAFFGGAGADSAPLSGAAHLWMAEARNYHGQPIPLGNFASYGHYTQCVWSATTKVGMAWTKNANGNVYVVGRYSVPGNMAGQTPY